MVLVENTSTRYFGKNLQITLATTLALAQSNSGPVLSNVDSLEWISDPNTEVTAAGFGSNMNVIKQKIKSWTGTLERYYNTDSPTCCGSTGHTGTCGSAGTFAAVVGAFQAGDAVPLFVRVLNLITNETVILCGCIGKYDKPVTSVEGYIMEKWDFDFTSIYYVQATS
jgi:hypothetical protein